MGVKVVQLGTPRLAGEGVRIGTVRRPPRGVPRRQYARRDYFDVWFPVLAPSAQTMQEFRKAAPGQQTRAWNTFGRRYRQEMKRPEASRSLDVLAALSHTGNFSVGCYCQDEQRCHRSILRELLAERGARLA